MEGGHRLRDPRLSPEACDNYVFMRPACTDPTFSPTDCVGLNETQWIFLGFERPIARWRTVGVCLLSLQKFAGQLPFAFKYLGEESQQFAVPFAFFV